MKLVKQVLEKKGSEVFHIAPDAPVYDALEVMAEKEIGALAVLRDGQLCGILSERDYARKVILRGKGSRDIPVKEIMSDNVVCVTPDQSVETCMGIMTEKRIRHLAVLDEEQLVGMISIGDVVKAVIDEQQFTIDQLEHYITSGG